MHISFSMILEYRGPQILGTDNVGTVNVSRAAQLLLETNTHRALQRCDIVMILPQPLKHQPRGCAVIFVILSDPLLYSPCCYTMLLLRQATACAIARIRSFSCSLLARHVDWGKRCCMDTWQYWPEIVRWPDVIIIPVTWLSLAIYNNLALKLTSWVTGLHKVHLHSNQKPAILARHAHLHYEWVVGLASLPALLVPQPPLLQESQVWPLLFLAFLIPDPGLGGKGMWAHWPHPSQTRHASWPLTS